MKARDITQKLKIMENRTFERSYNRARTVFLAVFRHFTHLTWLQAWFLILKNPPYMIIPRCTFIRQVRVIKHFSFKKGNEKKSEVRKWAQTGFEPATFRLRVQWPMQARAQIRSSFVIEFLRIGINVKKVCSRAYLGESSTAKACLNFGRALQILSILSFSFTLVSWII